jgi:hypothetical protein
VCPDPMPGRTRGHMRLVGRASLTPVGERSSTEVLRQAHFGRVSAGRVALTSDRKGRLLRDRWTSRFRLVSSEPFLRLCKCRPCSEPVANAAASNSRQGNRVESSPSADLADEPVRRTPCRGQQQGAEKRADSDITPKPTLAPRRPPSPSSTTVVHEAGRYRSRSAFRRVAALAAILRATADKAAV